MNATLAGELGPTIGSIRGTIIQVTRFSGEFIHALHPEWSWKFQVQLEESGQIDGHYGGVIVDRRIQGTLAADGTQCQLRVRTSLLLQRVSLRQEGMTIEGSVCHVGRNLSIQCIQHDMHVSGVVGSGIGQHTLEVDIGSAPALVVTGLAVIASLHLATYPDYFDS